ncbi:hypothetical protein BASA50_001977 [Batrachochytrium salamandrivorans]|uniref:tRNA (cytosine(38)-C(5))-methyltransferase n=1 Tax=Batrachochytrium salamandrivorans TaxID=1357716 RepID=A0ABQ8FMU5_9FUNG|nr:hypothetical protein BASA50_001977 [Batrachochytrium salamandrivorans]
MAETTSITPITDAQMEGSRMILGVDSGNSGNSSSSTAQPMQVSTTTPSPRPIRTLEFYSGIGGFHAALSKTHRPYTLVHAFDMNINANAVYAYTHPEVPISTKNIGFLTSTELDELAADLWLLSPPCQPYSRKGSRRGIQDARADSFVQLLQALMSMKLPPVGLVVENVFGFEASKTFGIMCDALRDYDMQTLELNPMHFGVPYSRPRVFVVARLRECMGCGAKARDRPDYLASEGRVDTKGGVDPSYCRCRQRRLAGFAYPELNGTVVKAECARQVFRDRFFQGAADQTTLQQLVGYLDADDGTVSSEHMYVEEKDLWAAARHFDVVGPESIRSCCFTKAYGSYARGGGSVVRTDRSSGWAEREAAAFHEYNTFNRSTTTNNRSTTTSNRSTTTYNYNNNNNYNYNTTTTTTTTHQSQGTEMDATWIQEPVPLHLRGKKRSKTRKKPEMSSSESKWWWQLSLNQTCPLAALRLRYFSPAEMGRLHGFQPDQLQFPASTTMVQRFKLIGNSLHVDVVRMLIDYVLE